MSKKSPQLRFEGFTDDWKERKLSDIADRFDNLRVPITASERKSGDTPYYGANGIQDYVEGFTHDGEFILVAEDGANDLKNYPVQYVNGKVWVNNHAHVLQGKNTITDNKFLMNSIKNFNIEPFLVGGGRAKLNADVMMKLNILLPTFDEQEKIGSFFKQLDDTIALHQRKLDLLKKQKKGFLQKMFPKNGSKVPELRFAGFADDWEEHKVGNFLSESKIKGSDGSVSKKLTVKLWRKGIVPKEEIYKGSSATQYYIRLAGQFMYGKLDFLNQAFGILPNELDGYESTLDSPAFDFKDGINPNFFLEYVCRENFYKYQGNIANGSRKAKRIHADTFFDMPITIPNFEEQQKIGSFFKQLDDTIALHQRKLDLLKEQKKGFLQKMFV